MIPRLRRPCTRMSPDGTAGRALFLVGVLAWAGTMLDAPPLAGQQRIVLSERGGTPGWLGVQYTVERSFAIAGRSVVRSDYLVSDVHPDGPAAAAGIRPGDVLLGIRGAGPGDTLFERISETIRAGDTVRLTFRRGDRRVTQPVVAVARPPEQRVGMLPSAELAGGERMLRIDDSSEERSGTTIVFRSMNGQGFSYRIVTPEPGTPFPFESFVVRTPATDSLTSLINLMRRNLMGIERATDLARGAVLRATTSASLDENAAELAGLREQRFQLTARLTQLQDELALLSRQRLGAMGREFENVRVRVSPAAPWTPLVRMERRYLIGAEIIPIDAVIGRYFGVDRGLLVATSPPGTPAAEAGLTPGDVIIRVGDVDVADAVELSGALRATRGDLILTVVRGGSEVQVQLR